MRGRRFNSELRASGAERPYKHLYGATAAFLEKLAIGGFSGPPV